MIQLRAARPADASAIAAIHADTWQETYAAMLPADVIAAEGYDARLAFWKKTLVHAPQGIFIAEDDKLGPMGFASSGPAGDPVRIDSGNFRGEVYTLYVRPVCQGMGLGQQLLESAIANLSRAGYSAVMLWVLADSAACKFYERMGGQPISERLADFGGKQLREIAYGWGGKLPKPARPEAARKQR
ncbi:MAG: GNAT family N-acetyltransferase [Alphaproteobacteria bacterium]